MATISLTKTEVSALWHAAGNMSNDFEDYFSFMPDIAKYKAAFDSGMAKLQKHLPKTKKLSDKEQQEHDYLNDN